MMQFLIPFKYCKCILLSDIKNIFGAIKYIIER